MIINRSANQDEHSARERELNCPPGPFLISGLSRHAGGGGGAAAGCSDRSKTLSRRTHNASRMIYRVIHKPHDDGAGKPVPAIIMALSGCVAQVDA
jgi:hypothetical protein